jgi:hypothetical protein
MNHNTRDYLPLLYATLSAVFFGSCAPVTRFFVSDIGPLTLASYFYLGSGLGMCVIILGGLIMRRGYARADAPISRSDIPYLAGMSLFGGIFAPVTLMYSMNTPAATGYLT